MTASGDMALAGLNFRTLRPRADIWRDYRDTVAAVYAPEAYFTRMRVIGRRVRQPRFQDGSRIFWGRALKDAASLFRVAWAMTVTRPGFARPFWSVVADCLRHRPLALEAVVRTAAAYVLLCIRCRSTSWPPWTHAWPSSTAATGRSRRWSPACYPQRPPSWRWPDASF